MCGDMDEVTGLDDELTARFLISAQALLSRYERRQAAETVDPAFIYPERLFHDALARARRDVDAAILPGTDGSPPADGDAGHDRLAMQALVFARLAGLLAGHLALNGDPLRKTIEALMHGYQEAETIEPDHGHDHDHDHGDHHHHDGDGGHHH